MRFVLFQPDIAPNVGTILRMAACFDVGVDIIEPCGFPWDTRILRRSALDYHKFVRIERYSSWSDYFDKYHEIIPDLKENSSFMGNTKQIGVNDNKSRLVLLTTKGEKPYYNFRFKPNDRIMVGRESAGVPEKVHLAAHQRLIIPMQPDRRSLNIAVALGIVAGEALRQTKLFSE